MARVAFVICGDPEATSDAVQSAWSIAAAPLLTRFATQSRSVPG